MHSANKNHRVAKAGSGEHPAHSSTWTLVHNGAEWVAFVQKQRHAGHRHWQNQETAPESFPCLVDGGALELNPHPHFVYVSDAYRLLFGCGHSEFIVPARPLNDFKPD